MFVEYARSSIYLGPLEFKFYERVFFKVDITERTRQLLTESYFLFNEFANK